MFISSINLKIGNNNIIENNNNDSNFTVSDDGNNNVTDKNLSHRALIFSRDYQPVTARLSQGVSRRHKGAPTVSAVHEVSHADVNSAEFVKVENKPSGKISGLIQQFNKVESSQCQPNLLTKNLKTQELHQNRLVNKKNLDSQSGKINKSKISISSNGRSLDPEDVVDRRQPGVLRIPEIALNLRIKANEGEVLANDLASSETVSYPESSISQESSTSRQLPEQVLVKSEEFLPETQQPNKHYLSPVLVVESILQSDRDSPNCNPRSKNNIVCDYKGIIHQNVPFCVVKSSSKVPITLSNENIARHSFKNVETKHGPCQSEASRGRVQRFEIDSSDKGKNPNFRFPLVRSAGVDEPHVSTTDGVDRSHVSITAGVDRPHVSTTYGVDRPHVSITAGVDRPHVSLTAGVDRPHVSTTDGVDRPHVSITAGVDRPHVSTSAGVDRPHVSTSAGVGRPRVSTTAGGNRPHVSTTAGVDRPHFSTLVGVDKTQVSISTCVKEAHVSTSSKQEVPSPTVVLSCVSQSSGVTTTMACNKETLNYSASEDGIVDETTERSSNGIEADIQSRSLILGSPSSDGKTDSSDKSNIEINISSASPQSLYITLDQPEDEIDGFGSKLGVLKSELMSLRQMDLVLLRQLMNISQSLQRIQRTEVPRVSRSLTFLSHKKSAQRRHWPVERQNSAPHVEHWRRFMFSSLQSATEDEVTDSFSSFDESEFDSQSELEESTTSLNSLFVPSPRSAAANKRRFFQSRDRIWTMDVTDDLDIDYEGILRRNVQLWKSLKSQNSVTEEVTVWY